MSITSALYSSFYGLRHTESQISVTSQNVTNADKAGYTRKELQSQYVTTNAGTVPVSGDIVTVNYNSYMLETLVADSILASKNMIVSDFMSAYADELGSLDGDNSLSAFLDDLATSMDQLTVTPEDTSLKNQVIAYADRLATEMNRLSATVQENRLKADQEIERKVRQVNQILDNLHALNKEIQEATSLGATTSNLLDDRHTQLEKLSELINYDYFINGQNQLQIYTAGRPLLDSRPRPLSYTSVTALDKTVLYPGGFNAIDSGGTDITIFLSGGEIGGLLSLRDQYMVEEQAKLDEFASALITSMNTLLNQGASVPPRPDMVGETTGLTLADPLAAAGNIRIATMDSDGIVQNAATINLGGFATIGDLIVGINAALGPDVTASLTTDGQLSLVANNAGEGLGINQLTSALPGGLDFSSYFGMNNMFDGTGADDIAIAPYLKANGHYLATARLDPTAGAGTGGAFIGDSSLMSEMHNAFFISYSFSAAGNFAAQNENINNYIGKIISDVAYRADNATQDAEITSALMEQTKTTLQNLSGVNIDEEMANLIDLEAKYEASATMVKALQDMYDTLLNAIR